MPKEFKEVVTVEEAEKRIRSALKMRRRHEDVSLGEALGRVLAVDVVAPIDVPPFDRAAMDGYALKARGTHGASESKPKELALKGSITAGMLSELVITKGSCAAIATGAPMPRGADAVVMVEYTESSGGHIKVYRPVVAGENIMRAGADIMKGERVLRKGHLLTPRDTGVLAALGITRIKVHARPRVAMISTGTEIALPGTPLKPGMIYDVNSRALA
ncbi:MAG: molybdopterin biosynthesis protein, partial [Candidatus Hydrothermarchaeaceae archaeon]